VKVKRGKVKKMRKAKVKLITALSLTVVMLAAMTGIAAAAGVYVHGQVVDSNNVGVADAEVNVYQSADHTNNIGTTTSNDDGTYGVDISDSGLGSGDTVYVTASKVDVGSGDDSGTITEYGWANVAVVIVKIDIPEFATLAIPMGIAILSGLFFLNHRKRREE